MWWLAGEGPTHPGRRVRVAGRLALLAALQPVELQVVLDVERQLGKRLEGRDEVQEQTMNGHVGATDAEKRRRRVVTQNDGLLRLNVTQPEIQRLVAALTTDQLTQRRRGLKK